MPENPSIIPGASQQFTATGTYSDGSTQNLTSQATWISSNALVATINAGGLATGVTAGTTTISASLTGVTGNTMLTIQSVSLAVTTASLSNGVVNATYTATLTANGGTLPYTWSIIDGSLPSGLTLNSSSGAITGIPSATGSVSFTAQVMDAGSPAQTVTKSLSITIVSVPLVTIWPSTTVPSLVDGGPDSAVELGVKFRSDMAGTITGIRFYKATANTGTHIGNLWSSTGAPLATAIFSNETASGWQQAFFATPVAIASNTVYVASYHANSGHYSADLNYFQGKGMDNPPLHALAKGVSGGNGVFAYGASSAFPNQTYNPANYWVDVVFRAGPSPTLTSIAVMPENPSIIPGASQQFTATGTYSDGSTQNLTSQATWISSNALVATINAGGLATGVTAGTTTISASLTGVTGNTMLTIQSVSLAVTTASLSNGVVNATYTATLTANGGTLPYTWSIIDGSLPSGLTLNSSSGAITGIPSATGSVSFTAQVMDAGSPAQTVTKSLSITIVSVPLVTIWPSTTVPSLVDGGPDSAVELGVKFRSDMAGTITGIRFYKAAANTGTHIGNLWSGTGTPLATAIFSNETASGWQQVFFATPVAIVSNTVYVASYHANSGHYSADLNYFPTGVDNPPLHALANGVSGGNGVFAYGASSAFPNQTYNAANYWVDVVFQVGPPPPPPALTSITVTPTNHSILTGASQQFTAIGTYSDDSTKNLTSQATWISSNTLVATINAGGLATGVTTGTTTISASLTGVTGNTVLTIQPAPLAITTASLPSGIMDAAYSATLIANGGTSPYTWSIIDGSLPPGLTLNPSSGTITGTPSATGSVSFTAQAMDASNPIQTATKPLTITITLSNPILVLTNAANPFSQYYAEILLTEGLNEFELKDISSVSSATLAPYDVVILGEIALTPSQVTSLSDWVNAGGNLIAMRPDKKLAGLLGLNDTGSTITNGYLLVNTSTGPGAGIVGETIQFHGTADRYTLGSAFSLATLYSNAQIATINPAVTLRSVSTNGGQAAAFTYDLARSIVYTRQGNPAWAGQDRDGNPPIRSDDLFYGAASYDPQPDWVDFNKVAIPQADEQQRLLANLIITMNSDKNLLPRFWYFPHGYEAVVVMTGDDHGSEWHRRSL